MRYSFVLWFFFNYQSLIALTSCYCNKYYGGLVTEAAGPDFKTNYTYDLAGRRTSMTDGQGTTSYAYDPANGSLTGLKVPGRHANNLRVQQAVSHRLCADRCFWNVYACPVQAG
nr:RHS repeat domain-containing protein [Paenibacillus sp. IHB B 3084]